MMPQTVNPETRAPLAVIGLQGQESTGSLVSGSGCVHQGRGGGRAVVEVGGYR